MENRNAEAKHNLPVGTRPGVEGSWTETGRVDTSGGPVRSIRKITFSSKLFDLFIFQFLGHY